MKDEGGCPGVMLPNPAAGARVLHRHVQRGSCWAAWVCSVDLGRLCALGPVRFVSKTQIDHLLWMNLGGFINISDLRASHVKLVDNSSL